MKLNISTSTHSVGRKIAEKLDVKYLGIRVRKTESSTEVAFIFRDPKIIQASDSIRETFGALLELYLRQIASGMGVS